MSKTDSNVGVEGEDSLRLGGMRVTNLPMVPAAHAKQEMPAFLKSSKENKIDSIKAQYPKQTVDWIAGTIREVTSNIQRCRDLLARTETSINEYSGLIALCRHRDKQLLPLDAVKNADAIKALRKQFPPYNLKAMKTQVGQFKATINRCNEVIDKEHKTLSDLAELKGVCEQRDQALAAVQAS